MKDKIKAIIGLEIANQETVNAMTDKLIVLYLGELAESLPRVIEKLNKEVEG